MKRRGTEPRQERGATKDTWRIRLVAAVGNKILGEGNPRTHPLIYIYATCLVGINGCLIILAHMGLFYGPVTLFDLDIESFAQWLAIPYFWKLLSWSYGLSLW